MTDLVRAYLAVEQRLLAHRFAERSAGRQPISQDPFEMQIAAELDALWERMVPDEWRELRARREDLRRWEGSRD